METKVGMFLVIVGIFVLIFLLFFFAWGGTLLVGVAGVTVYLLLYVLIVFTPIKKFYIRAFCHRELSNNRLYDALVVAISFY